MGTLFAVCFVVTTGTMVAGCLVLGILQWRDERKQNRTATAA